MNIGFTRKKSVSTKLFQGGMKGMTAVLHLLKTGFLN